MFNRDANTPLNSMTNGTFSCLSLNARNENKHFVVKMNKILRFERK